MDEEVGTDNISAIKSFFEASDMLAEIRRLTTLKSVYTAVTIFSIVLFFVGLIMVDSPGWEAGAVPLAFGIAGLVTGVIGMVYTGKSLKVVNAGPNKRARRRPLIIL
ncbi:MAG: hypothetical protein ACYS8W_18350 [Planctomycetota bacterium]|jgi:hypothetical protein